MPESAQTTTYTKQSFSEARQKLFPAAFISYLLSQGVHFLKRVSSSFYKEVNTSQTTDEIVQIVITKERAKALEKQCIRFL